MILLSQNEQPEKVNPGFVQEPNRVLLKSCGIKVALTP